MLALMGQRETRNVLSKIQIRVSQQSSESIQLGQAINLGVFLSREDPTQPTEELRPDCRSSTLLSHMGVPEFASGM